jgi:hypothetical protein
MIKKGKQVIFTARLTIILVGILILLRDCCLISLPVASLQMCSLATQFKGKQLHVVARLRDLHQVASCISYAPTTYCSGTLGKYQRPLTSTLVAFQPSTVSPDVTIAVDVFVLTHLPSFPGKLLPYFSAHFM